MLLADCLSALLAGCMRLLCLAHLQVGLASGWLAAGWLTVCGWLCGWLAVGSTAGWVPVTGLQPQLPAVATSALAVNSAPGADSALEADSAPSSDCVTDAVMLSASGTGAKPSAISEA